MNTKREIPTSVYFDHERLTPNLAMLDSQYLLPTLQDLRRPRQFKIPSFKHCIALHPGKEEVNSYFIQPPVSNRSLTPCFLRYNQEKRQNMGTFRRKRRNEGGGLNIKYIPLTQIDRLIFFIEHIFKITIDIHYIN